jgi:S-adenosylmethionine:tRNA ribosyltransferase-isomerase
VLTRDFDYFLPEELIAQQPPAERGGSRLMVIPSEGFEVKHTVFAHFSEFLRAGDILVLNDSRVFPARLRGQNAKTGGVFEILLLEETAPNEWWTMVRPGKRARVGTEITILSPHQRPTDVSAVVLNANDEGHRHLRFSRSSGAPGADFRLVDVLDELGEVPLPPYIKRDAGESSSQDRSRYQTIYANQQGSVAAPTAGLHFTESTLAEIRAKAVEVCFVTLHVGLGTFAPVKAERVEEHAMHFERFHVSDAVAQTINAAKREGRRVIAVGTTSVRVLETLARDHDGKIVSGMGRTNIFIYPPYNFRVVDALVTNFHLPCSTLLMLVSAFAAPGEMTGREKILAAYAEAVRERYRFFSYGDAMFIA